MSIEALVSIGSELSFYALIEKGRLIEFQIDNRDLASKVGNIYRGKIRRIVPEMQAVFVDIGLPELGFLSLNESIEKGHDIERRFRQGQTVWVQCIKDAVNNNVGLPQKSVRLSTKLSLSSACLVYFPYDNHTGASKKIGDETQRRLFVKHLRDLLQDKQRDGGFIIRTAARKLSTEKLLEAAENMLEDWNQVKLSMLEAKKPRLVYQAPHLVEQLMQDCVCLDIDKISLNQADQNLRLLFEQKLSGTDISLDVIDTDELMLLKQFEIDQQLKMAMSAKVDMENGGSVIIERTEALISIDVNMGSAAYSSAQQVNLQAAKIIAEQIRIRNLSGIIIVDFINLNNQSARRELLENFSNYVSRDPIRTEVHGMTSLGLVELTRERSKLSLDQLLVTSTLFSVS